MSAWWIEVASLRTTATLGVTKEERAHPQPVELSLKVVPRADMSVSDNLADTTDYGALVSLALKELSETHCLLETYVSRIAHVLLECPGIQAVRVSLTKCAPPLAQVVAGVTVVYESGRSEAP
jgi:dihydroneopterin aldolase